MIMAKMIITIIFINIEITVFLGTHFCVHIFIALSILNKQ